MTCVGQYYALPCFFTGPTRFVGALVAQWRRAPGTLNQTGDARAGEPSGTPGGSVCASEADGWSQMTPWASAANGIPLGHHLISISTYRCLSSHESPLCCIDVRSAWM
jgi:hypothetical protein